LAQTKKKTEAGKFGKKACLGWFTERARFNSAVLLF